MITSSLLALCALVTFQDAEFRPNAADWNARDQEARWVLLEAETLAHGWRNVEPMIEFLEARREFELLERLCLYPRSEGQFATFEAALARLDAPQWARAVEWNLRQHDSHKRDEATAAFLERRPQLALDWLERNEEQLSPRGGDVLKRLRELNVERAPSGHLLAPWKLEEVLAPLTSKAEIVDFGARHHATPGELYLHTVENALRAIAQKQVYEAPWADAVIALTRHARPEVRAFAWIALGEAQRGKLAVSALSDATVLAAIDDPNEDPRVRIAATVALGQRSAWSPHAWDELHRIAETHSHPAWAAAVDSLREVGDEFSILVLEDALPTLREDAHLRLARASIEALRERGEIASSVLGLTLERTAFAELVGDPIGPRRANWMRRFFAQASENETLRSALRSLAAEYTAAEDVQAAVSNASPAAKLTPRVREWARELSARQRR